MAEKTAEKGGEKETLKKASLSPSPPPGGHFFRAQMELVSGGHLTVISQMPYWITPGHFTGHLESVPGRDRFPSVY
jgi:hypothetical protein